MQKPKRRDIYVFLGATFVSGILLAAISFAPAPLRSVAELLDPFGSVWTGIAHKPRDLEGEISAGVRAAVHVFFDEWRVPHIVASSQEDGAFALGYIEASERMAQLDLSYRSAAGRLAEVLGPEALPSDIAMRAIGLDQAAEASLAEAMQSPKLKAALESFSAGVNAYLSTASPSSLPVEYQLIGFSPEPWTPLKSIFIYKMLDWMMSAPSSFQRQFAAAQKQLGATKAKALFPAWDYRAIPMVDFAKAPPFVALPMPPNPPDFVFDESTESLPPGDRKTPPPRGSNAWAVTAAHSTSGHPMLAADPHLPLQQPSLWFELQMQLPESNVYGITVPGLPFVVMGFNDALAWALTNGESANAQWYAVKFKDASRSTYLYDGAWVPTRKVTSTIHVKGQADVLRSVLYTNQGPVVRPDKLEKGLEEFPPSCALRWVGHESTHSLEAFLSLSTATDMPSFQRALRKHESPVFNFVVAAAEGSIGAFHQGLLPLRSADLGLGILDGSEPRSRFSGYIPFEQLPFLVNPERGWVASTNNPPVGPAYPYALPGHYESFARAKRLEDVLGRGGVFSPDDMMRLQMDNHSSFAAALLPLLLKAIEKGDLEHAERLAAENLRAWNNTYTAHQIAPTIFFAWKTELSRLAFPELMAARGALPTPSDQQLLALAEGRDLEAGEFSGLAQRAFHKAFLTLTRVYGPLGPRWQLRQVQPVRIEHILGLPGFGAQPLDLDGNYDVLNATFQDSGPSWRMLVTFEDTGEGLQAKAWGGNAGAQSEDLRRPDYDKAMAAWSQGKLHELRLIRGQGDPAAAAMRHFTIRGQ